MSQAKKLETEVNSTSLIESETEKSKSQQLIDTAINDVARSLAVNYNVAAIVEKQPERAFKIINPDGSDEGNLFNTYWQAVGELLCFKDVADTLDVIRGELDSMNDEEWDEWCHQTCEDVANDLGYQIVAVEK